MTMILMKHIQFVLGPLALIVIGLMSAQAAVTTPEPGTPQRVALMDALRTYFVDEGHGRAEGDARPLPEKVVWQVEELRVEGDSAWFSGSPAFESGADSSDYLEALAYFAWLVKEGESWQVRAASIRGDVPSLEELLQIQAQLPADFPQNLATGIFALPQPQRREGEFQISTPAKGSAARTALMDALRAYFVETGYGRIGGDARPLPEKVVWRVSELKVCGGWAFVAGRPQFESGRSTEGWLVDTDYMALLGRQKLADGKDWWQVAINLSRSDAASDEERQQLRQLLPPNFPWQILPESLR